MPTGTKIAAIVLVVLLAAAGLYYAFVPAPQSSKSANSKTPSDGSTFTRPSTLPPAGLGVGTAAGGATTTNGTTTGSTTGTTIGTTTGTTTSGATTGGLDVLAERQRQLNAANQPSGLNPNNGANPTGSTNPVVPGTPTGTGLAPTTTTAPAGAVGAANSNTTAPTSTDGTTSSGFGKPFSNGRPTVAVNGTGTGTGTGNSAGNSAGNGSGNGLPEARGMQAGAESTYIVKKGDTFGSIAMALLGSTKKADAISKANPTVDPTRMKIGTKLRIPSATPSADGAIASTTKTGSKSATPAGTTASNTANKPAAAGALATKSTTAGTHIVVAGETLSSIAKKYYGDSSLYQAIAKANPKIKPNDLAVGDKLTIPAKTVVVGGEKIDR